MREEKRRQITSRELFKSATTKCCSRGNTAPAPLSVSEIDVLLQNIHISSRHNKCLLLMAGTWEFKGTSVYSSCLIFRPLQQLTLCKIARECGRVLNSGFQPRNLQFETKHHLPLCESNSRVFVSTVNKPGCRDSVSPPEAKQSSKTVLIYSKIAPSQVKLHKSRILLSLLFN